MTELQPSKWLEKQSTSILKEDLQTIELMIAGTDNPARVRQLVKERARILTILRSRSEDPFNPNWEE